MLAAMGSAVGLGNVWRFPFVTGEHGGAAFILVYLGCVLAVGLPIMTAELLVGRSTQRGVIGAFATLRPGSAWLVTGWLGATISFVLLSYYSVVGGWVLHYMAVSLTGGFAGLSPEAIGQSFTSLSTSPALQIFWHAVFMLTTIWVVSRGVSRGIEWGNKIMMPALFLMLCCLLVYALTTEGASKGIAFLLTPHWDKIGPRAVLAALGQAFFSLSVGLGMLVTYGSYLQRDSNLPRSALLVAASDTGIALLAGFVIFPLVFTFQLEPNAGPALIFETLPITFSQLPFGQFLAVLFFLLLTFAALSSSMSALEVVVAYVVDERGCSRRPASWMAGGAIFGVGLFSAVNGIDQADTLVTNYLLPVSGLLVALFGGWALTHQERRAEVPASALPAGLYYGWVFLLRFVAPLAVAIIVLQSIGLF